MAAKKGSKNNRALAALELVGAARANPYLRRLIEDRTVRRRLLGAYGAARSAYSRAANGRPPVRALVEDRKLQKDLLEAVGALKDVARTVRAEPAKAARGGKLVRRSLLLASVGSLVAVAASKKARGKVLDLLFGKEEEFTYTPPAASEPQPTTTSSGQEQ